MGSVLLIVLGFRVVCLAFVYIRPVSNVASVSALSNFDWYFGFLYNEYFLVGLGKIGIRCLPIHIF
jgi:hypothetical protein